MLHCVNDLHLENFGKHVPPVLGRQIISKHINKIFNLIENEENCSPSIERFHGILLFVDISGFTVLSQKLTVDELRIHINGYFHKILNITDKYGGEVVKFAGDALFIIWQTEVMRDGFEANYCSYIK
jgi:hypothetical protein